MKYTKKVPYFKKGDKIDKAFRKLPKEQKEAILKISSAQKEQERKDRLSSVGGGFRRPTAVVIAPVDTRSAQIENTVGKKAARTFDQAFQQARERGDKEFAWKGKRYHTRTAEEEAERKAQESKTSGGNTNVENTNVENTNVENTNVENTPAETNAQTNGDSLSRINLPAMTDTRSPQQIVEQTKLDQAAAAQAAASNADASSRESDSMQSGGNPTNTGSNTSYPIIEPRRNSFMGNITARSTTPIVTITGVDGRVWQGNRYRNLGPAQFAELKSGQDTWSRRVLNNEHYFTLNGKEIRKPDLYIIDLFDNLDYEDSKAMAQEKERRAIGIEHIRKYPNAAGTRRGLGGYTPRFQQGGQMPQGDKLHLRNIWERMFGITPDYTPVNSQESITSYMDNTHKGPVEKRVIRKEVPYADLYSTMSIRNPGTNRADTTFTAPSGTKYDMNDVRSGKAPSGYSYKFFRKPAGYFQQGGQMPQEGSQEELVLDFAVRYLVTMGVPEEDIMDPQGNLNPEHQQELEQVFNSQEIDWSDYAASPDEYMQQFIGNLQAQAQMARKGAKLKRLSQLRIYKK